MSLESELVEEAVLLSIPVLTSWIRSRILAGDDPAKAAADVEALFAAADAAIDLAEDAKFGPEPTTKK